MKTTVGKHERPFHVSLGEVHFAAENPNYVIVRISEIRDDAKFVVLGGVSSWATEVVAWLETAPPMMRVDGVSVSPEICEGLDLFL